MHCRNRFMPTRQTFPLSTTTRLTSSWWTHRSSRKRCVRRCACRLSTATVARHVRWLFCCGVQVWEKYAVATRLLVKPPGDTGTVHCDAALLLATWSGIGSVAGAGGAHPWIGTRVDNTCSLLVAMAPLVWRTCRQHVFVCGDDGTPGLAHLCFICGVRLL